MWPFRYHSVDEEWQHTTCKTLGLDFKKANKIGPGSADLPLTRPNMRTIKKINPDGNCMFRSLSCVVTGCQDQHHTIRCKVVQHMRDIAPLVFRHIKTGSSYKNCQSVDEYVRRSMMDKDGIGVVILNYSVLLTCPKHVCSLTQNGPHNVDRTIPVDVSAKSVYLFHPTSHYDLVGCTVKVPSESKSNKISRVELSLVTQNPRWRVNRH